MKTVAPPNAPARGQSGAVVALVLTGAAFLAYFCMYAFRKPFTVGNYSEGYFLGTSIKLKTALVVSQLLGYAVSKFLGIKYCSEVGHTRRAAWLVGCIAFAQAALIAFAIVPGDWKVLAIFLNGLPLGMVWGFIIAYLEGRRVFEAVIAGLSCSFIISTGMVKDVGAILLRHGVSEWWMPAATGALFLAPFLLAIFLLERVPGPTAQDIAARLPREPMNRADRWRFARSFWPGLVPLILLYLLLTAFRDYRDNFGIEVFQQLGYAARLGLFTQSEVPVAIGVFLSMIGLTLVKENRRALAIIYVVILIGLAFVGAATALRQRGHLGGFAWMLLIGLGSYLAYVPFGAILFDRLVAALRFGGTSVFAIYLADSIAYLGVIAVQLDHDFFFPTVSRLDFLTSCSARLPLAGVPLLALSWWFFSREPRK